MKENYDEECERPEREMTPKKQNKTEELFDNLVFIGKVMIIINSYYLLSKGGWAILGGLSGLAFVWLVKSSDVLSK